MSLQVLLEGTTSADQSLPFSLDGASSEKIVTVFVGGLAGAETARLQRKNFAGTYADVTTQDFTEFTAELNSVAVIGPGTYRVDKDATVAAAYVELES